MQFQFIREQVEKKTIKVEYCSTTNQIADLMTKLLPKNCYLKLRSTQAYNEPDLRGDYKTINWFMIVLGQCNDEIMQQVNLIRNHLQLHLLELVSYVNPCSINTYISVR